MTEAVAIKAPREDATQKPRSGGEHLEPYFQQLVGVFRVLPESARLANPAVYDDVARLTATPTCDVCWAKVYQIELALLKLLPENDLRRKAWALRAEFLELAGPARFALYQASHPPDPQTADIEILRADLVQLLIEIQWLYTSMPAGEQLRGLFLMRTLAISAVFVFVSIGVVLWKQMEVPVLLLVFFAGAVGGLISTLRRIQTTSIDSNICVSMMEMQRGGLSVYISPFIGAVFAAIFYILLLGGFITGPIFPALSTPKCEQSTVDCFKQFINHSGPVAGIDYAKLIVWSFLAGFAEMLVPDVLSQFARRPSEAANKTPTSP